MQSNGKNFEEALEKEWNTNKRWKGIKRPYTASDVEKISGTVQIEYTLAKLGAERLWNLLHTEPYVAALGALTGNQAVQQVQAGLKAIYVSGWQVAADANSSHHMYPDQSLYSVDSVPTLCKKINNALMRSDRISHMEGKDDVHWFAPLVADAEAGFGGNLNAYELMRSMIENGAAAVHFEDQLSSVKKCGHMGGKVVVPISEFVQKLVSARLAADVARTPTIIIARTDAYSAQLITSDVDAADHPFIDRSKGRTVEGFFNLKTGSGLDNCINRALAYAPYADLLWFETSTPDVNDAKKFAEAVHAKFPGKLLAYNCSPSFNWRKNLSDEQIRTFQQTLGKLGYKFQFVTLAGFHTLNSSMFELAHAYKTEGMAAYSRVQDKEFDMEKKLGFRAVKHQSFVGTGYFDEVQNIITNRTGSTLALLHSTEEEQFMEPQGTQQKV